MKLKSVLCAMCCACSMHTAARAQNDPVLLFHVSADSDLTANTANGDRQPNFSDKVRIVPDGRYGSAIEWDDDGILAWNAPGNLQAQRGTLGFFWRSRYPVGETPFVIFRAGYADHSSWDMAWLRIDWNGHGFDAFVTDANLARHRVSYRLEQLPSPQQWLHLAFAWDEDFGVRLFVDGHEIARKEAPADFDAALDQFGLAGRILSPYQVQSRYNFLRGSDVDEIRIYDRMLDDAGMHALAHNQTAVTAAATRNWQRAWRYRYGWQDSAPPVLTSPLTTITKVEFADTRDLKQWMWKGTDGIAETTWPGVYNRSRLPGRSDYFILPDWNTYVEGGRHLDLTIPDNQHINRIEIRGAAFGTLSYLPHTDAKTHLLFERPPGIVRSAHEIHVQQGGQLRFTNTVPETPIQEIWGYHVSDAREPEDTFKQHYQIDSQARPDYENLADLRHYIAGRHPERERSTIIALPHGAARRGGNAALLPSAALPVVHILIPSSIADAPAAQPLVRSWAYSWENMYDGLDGIAIDVPALNIPATHGSVIALNIRIKDPLWPARDMIDVSMSVRPGEARTVYLDMRDRILSTDSLWISIASAAPEFSAHTLDGANIRLIFKPRIDAMVEHVTDRFNQVRDNWGFLVEEHTTSKRQRLYARVHADLSDLLRVDPDHTLGRLYWNYISYNSQGRPPFIEPEVPEGIPSWAFLQLEDLKQVRRFVKWWIDQRQVDYGDFGGGLSDDSDLVQQWPGLALMGVIPDEINVSLHALAEAVYRNGMFTHGLSTIETDELHAYEEGINSNSAMLYLNWGDPLTLERLMETTRALNERIILKNPHGHLLFSSNWYGGHKVYREPNWQWQKPYSFPVLHPAFLLGQYNADPTSRHLITGLADGYLAHAYTADDGQWVLPNEIHWATGNTRGGELLNGSGGGDLVHLFWAAWRWSGDTRYLRALDYRALRSGPTALGNLGENIVDILGHQADWGRSLIAAAQRGTVGFPSVVAWQLTGDTSYLDALHLEGIRAKAQREYMNTEGHWWSDRVEAPSQFLQRARLGGIALRRNQSWPGHTVSWRFSHDRQAEEVALLVHAPSPEKFRVIAHNTGHSTAQAHMTAWNVTAGRWQMRSGLDRDHDGKIDGRIDTQIVELERSTSTRLHFAPGQTRIFEFELLEAGMPVEIRPDLGIGPQDIRREDETLHITVHSLGHADTGPAVALLEDARGHELARIAIPALPAPRDLTPCTVQVSLPYISGAAQVRVTLDGDVPEVTQLNNMIRL